MAVFASRVPYFWIIFYIVASGVLCKKNPLVHLSGLSLSTTVVIGIVPAMVVTANHSFRPLIVNSIFDFSEIKTRKCQNRISTIQVNFQPVDVTTNIP